MIKFDRRRFLKLAGGTAVVGALHRLGLVGLDSLAARRQQRSEPVSDQQVLGTCRLCAGGCGLSARVLDGRVVKLDGNPFHPNNQGRLCPKGQAGLQALYDPDRIKMPMRRVAGQGWQQVSWQEALGEISGKLQALRDSGHPERLVFLHDGKRGPTSDLIARFCQVFGTPNDVRYPSHSADGTPLAHWLTQGWNEHAGYDWENTNYLLCFGGALLEAWQPLVRQLRGYSRMRRGRPHQRAKIVQIESRGSVTAAKADEWVSIRPGTEGALALSIAHVIIRDGIFDADFVAEHTFGFEDWTDDAGKLHIGFSTLVLRDYAPVHVSEITGVSEEMIERIAREFAAARPAAVAAGDVSGYSNSLYSQWAVHTLNALVGSIDAPGGVLRQMEPPLASWPEPTLDEIAAQGLAQPRADGANTAEFPLAESVPHALTQAPYPIDILFLYHSNPIYDNPSSDWEAVIENVPLVVSLSPYLDETSEHADLLLPDSIYLEKWFLEPLEPSLGHPAVGLGQPIIEPLYDTRNTADVLIELARAVGGPVAAAMPWNGFVEAIQEQARGLYQAGYGLPSADTFDEFWAELQARGVWYDQPYEFGQWERVFATPSGKFEFASQLLKERLGALDTSFDSEDLLSHYQPPLFAGDESEYPFHLHTFKMITYTERWGANLPWLQEIYGLHVQEKWNSWVELNPETAHTLGIADGDIVRLESPQGSIELKVRLWPGTPHDMVSVPLGQGHTSGGRWAENRGANPNEIIAPLLDSQSGELATQSTRVRIRRV
ncbi:MAG: molybdopterin-dependent oxidoreductase [Chloroflexi bacterium]|nr:molybdopterin-dependent oxidoreductase [Chloroflexota bacterium]